MILDGRVVELVCDNRACRQAFYVPRRRGRVPTTCPDCRVRAAHARAASALDREDNAIRRAARDNYDVRVRSAGKARARVALRHLRPLLDDELIGLVPDLVTVATASRAVESPGRPDLRRNVVLVANARGATGLRDALLQLAGSALAYANSIPATDVVTGVDWEAEAA